MVRKGSSSTLNAADPADDAIFDVRQVFCLVLWLCLSVILGAVHSGLAIAEESLPAKYAFAKASPLLVFESPDLTGGRRQNFDFGKAYGIDEAGPEYVKLKLDGGRYTYVRAAHVTQVQSPKWLNTASGYNTKERGKIRFWENPVKLNQFLAGINPLQAQWDYEEYFEAAPDFPLSLPLIQTDTLELRGGTEQRRAISVMMRVSRDMYQKFDEAAMAPQAPLALHLLVDVSGSAKGFVERAIGAFLKALARNESLAARIKAVSITEFGASRTRRSVFLGKMSLREMDSIKWFEPGADQKTDGEREPLIDGLTAMQSHLDLDVGTAPVLIILSGADVELSSVVGGSEKQTSIEDMDLHLPNRTPVIFAQITPEPGEDLLNASRKFSGTSNKAYVEYSGTVGSDVLSELIRLVEEKGTLLALEKFLPVVEAAHKQRTMAFLPRLLFSGCKLPARQNYELESDWYTVPLWVTFDPLLWRESP
jgi:hypothetical protein